MSNLDELPPDALGEVCRHLDPASVAALAFVNRALKRLCALPSCSPNTDAFGSWFIDVCLQAGHTQLLLWALENKCPLDQYCLQQISAVPEPSRLTLANNFLRSFAQNQRLHTGLSPEAFLNFAFNVAAISLVSQANPQCDSPLFAHALFFISRAPYERIENILSGNSHLEIIIWNSLKAWAARTQNGRGHLTNLIRRVKELLNDQCRAYAKKAKEMEEKSQVDRLNGSDGNTDKTGLSKASDLFEAAPRPQKRPGSRSSSSGDEGSQNESGSDNEGSIGEIFAAARTPSRIESFKFAQEVDPWRKVLNHQSISQWAFNREDFVINLRLATLPRDPPDSISLVIQAALDEGLIRRGGVILAGELIARIYVDGQSEHAKISARAVLFEYRQCFPAPVMDLFLKNTLYGCIEFRNPVIMEVIVSDTAPTWVTLSAYPLDERMLSILLIVTAVIPESSTAFKTNAALIEYRKSFPTHFAMLSDFFKEEVIRSCVWLDRFESLEALLGKPIAVPTDLPHSIFACICRRGENLFVVGDMNFLKNLLRKACHLTKTHLSAPSGGFRRIRLPVGTFAFIGLATVLLENSSPEISREFFKRYFADPIDDDLSIALRSLMFGLKRNRIEEVKAFFTLLFQICSEDSRSLLRLRCSEYDLVRGARDERLVEVLNFVISLDHPFLNSHLFNSKD